MSALMDYPDILKTKHGMFVEPFPVFVPAQIFHATQVVNLLNEHGADVIRQALDDTSVFFQKTTGYGYGNSHTYISNTYGDLFKFLVTKTSITVWNTRDAQLFCKETTPENLKEMVTTLDRYSEKGEIPCSRCHNPMVYADNRTHRYFAGIYCEKCWNGDAQHEGMKAVEARESYN